MSSFENISGSSTSTSVADVQFDAEYKTSILQNIKNKVEPILQKIHDQRKKQAAEEFFYNNLLQYMSRLWEIDFLIANNETNPDMYYDEIHDINKNIIKIGDELVESINIKPIGIEIKKAFRTLPYQWIYSAKVMKHAYEKPLGYPGDYQIIEMIYNNKPFSPGMGHCFDRYILENDYANAVRGRKDKMKEMLVEYINENNSDVEILNIACGPCREITEIFAENSFNKSKKITFSLVDRDPNALKYAEKNLKNLPSNVNCKFIQDNVMDYIENPLDYHKALKDKDYIYSIGLFDYLPDMVVKQLIIFLYTLLNPEGKLIFGHKDSKTYKPLDPDWYCDWKFYHRNKKDVIDIVNSCGFDNPNLSITRETVTKIIFLLTIQKKY